MPAVLIVADHRAQLLAELETLRHAPNSQPRPTISLSPREHAVLIRLSRGLTNPEIARQQRMSFSTVKTHVQHILGKLDTTDRTQTAFGPLSLACSTGPDGR